MKKILTYIFAGVALMFAGGAQAQKLGINVGYASEYLPTYTVVERTQVTSYNMTGLFLNANYTLNFSKHWGVAIGVGGRYNMREYPSTLLTFPATTRESQWIVDVPLVAVFTVPFSDYSSVNIFCGPMVSYGITGKSTITEQMYGEHVDVSWYGSNALYRQLNIQGTAGIAIDVHRLRLFGGYSLGILSIDPRENSKINTSALYLGLGVTL